VLLLLQLLRAVSARLLLHDGPHALVGHSGGEHQGEELWTSAQ
jgi:hypothetical protein